MMSPDEYQTMELAALITALAFFPESRRNIVMSAANDSAAGYTIIERLAMALEVADRLLAQTLRERDERTAELETAVNMVNHATAYLPGDIGHAEREFLARPRILALLRSAA